MDIQADLMYDPNEIGPDCVVTCWISQGPRATDPGFDPQPGDRVALVDDDDELLRGRVIQRAGNVVTVHVDLTAATSHPA